MAPLPLDPEAVEYVMERSFGNAAAAVAALRSLPHRRALDNPSPEWLDKFAASVGVQTPLVGTLDERVRTVADAVAAAHGAHDALELARAVDVMTPRGELWETIKVRCRAGAYDAAARGAWRGVDDVRAMVQSVTDCATAAGDQYFAFVVEKATTSPDPARWAAMALAVCLVDDLYRQVRGDMRGIMQRCLALANLPADPRFGVATMCGVILDACPPGKAVKLARGYAPEKRPFCIVAMLMIDELEAQLQAGLSATQCAMDMARRALMSGA